MRKTKLWSVLLAALLLCACVVGVLIVGAQADSGTDYTWYVDGVGESSDHYTSINQAVLAAKNKADWESGDTLTIIMEANGGNASVGNWLFGVKPIFVATGEMLPITIDGQGTYGFDLATTVAYAVCTNNYTFKDLVLPWRDNNISFGSGCAQVVFDNVSFTGSGSNFRIGADFYSRANFRGISVADFNAMALTGEDSVKYIKSTLTLKDTNYTTNWMVCSKLWSNGIDTSQDTGADNPTGLAITNKNVVTEVIIDSSDIGRVRMFAPSAATGNADTPREMIFTLKAGSTMKGFYGVYGLLNCGGNCTVNLDGTNDSTAIAAFRYDTTSNTTPCFNGTFTFNLGPNFSTGANVCAVQNSSAYSGTVATGDFVINLNGYNVDTQPAFIGPYYGTLENVTVNINSGTITNYAYASGLTMNGTITGTLTTNVNGGTITNFAALGISNANPSIGKIVNNYVGGTISTYAFGGNAANDADHALNTDIDNHYLGTTFSKGPGSTAGLYGGSMKSNITATVTNYYGEKDGTPVRWTTNNGVVGGNQAGGSITKVVNHLENVQLNSTSYLAGRTGAGQITENYFYDGFTLNGSAMYCGANNTAISGSVTNTFYGGSAASGKSIYGGSGSGAVGTINNHFLGGSFLGTVCGGSGGTGAVTTVNNYLGKIEGGVKSGSCRIQLFYGGANGAAATSTINNTFYSGILGNATGAGTGVSTSVVSYCGSKAGTVGIINNTFNGGSFNCGWFYCGNGTGVTFNAALHDFAEGECQINNDVNAGAFSRFCGGGVGAVDSIRNEIGSASSGEIVTYSGALYCGQGSGVSASTSVSNRINGYIDTFYGGTNTGDVGTITNAIVSGANIGGFYAANNTAGAVTGVTTTVSGGSVTTFCGGGRAMTTAVDTITNTVSAGSITNFYGNSALSTGSVTTVTNTVSGGSIANYFGGSNAAAAINTINNTFSGGTIGSGVRDGNGLIAASVKCYGGSTAGTVGVITNAFSAPGTTFNCGYFYCGNGGTATFDGALHDFEEGECQVTNTLRAGDFVRYAGGCDGGAVTSVKNVVGGATAGAISAYQPEDGMSSSIYGGQGATASTDIYNTIDGYISDFFGGGNTDAVGNVYNTIVTGANISNCFYGGGNSNAAATSITNTVTDGTIRYYFGGTHKPLSGDIGSITNYFYGGTYTGYAFGGSRTITNDEEDALPLTLNITSITNVLGDPLDPSVYPTFNSNFAAGIRFSEAALDGIKVYHVGTITTTINNASMAATCYLGSRMGFVDDIVVTINDIDFRGADLYIGNNQGSVTGSMTLTVNGGTLGGRDDMPSTLTVDCSPDGVYAGTKPSVTIGAGTVLNVHDNGYWNFRGPSGLGASMTVGGGSVTVNQLDGWLNRNYFYGATVQAGATIVITEEATVYRPGEYEQQAAAVYAVVRGIGIPISENNNAFASLVLTSRMNTKFYLRKALVDEYKAKFRYSFSINEEVIVSGVSTDLKTVVNVEGVDYYVLEMPGIALSDFDTSINFYNTILESYDFTIQSLAAAGAATYAERDPVAEALFQAIANLKSETVPTYDTVTPAPWGKAGSGLITFTGKNLIMGDAIGIRLYASDATKANLAGARIWVNNAEVTNSCSINAEEGYIDFYVNVSKMQSTLWIDIYDENLDQCLLLKDQIDWIAQSLINSDGSNLLAKQVLAYIQAANAYADSL